jgi:hypothetical protein
MKPQGRIAELETLEISEKAQNDGLENFLVPVISTVRCDPATRGLTRNVQVLCQHLLIQIE